MRPAFILVESKKDSDKKILSHISIQNDVFGFNSKIIEVYNQQVNLDYLCNSLVNKNYINIVGVTKNKGSKTYFVGTNGFKLSKGDFVEWGDETKVFRGKVKGNPKTVKIDSLNFPLSRLLYIMNNESKKFNQSHFKDKEIDEENTNIVADEKTTKNNSENISSDTSFYDYAEIKEHKKGRMLKKITARCNQKIIIVPSEIKIIGAKAFAKNKYVEEVIFSEGVLEIRSNVFEDCLNLKKVVLPESLTKIGKYPFNNNPNLKSLTVPKNVTFFNLSHLNLIDLDVLKIHEDNENYIIKNGVVIQKEEFLKNQYQYYLHYVLKSFKEKTLNIPGCVRYFAENFVYLKNRPSIKKIIINSDIREDYSYYKPRFEIFSNFENLEEYIITSDKNNTSFKTLNGVLYYYDEIISYPPAKTDTEFILPKNIKKISDHAFRNVKNLKKIFIHKDVERISSYAFDNDLNYTIYTDAPNNNDEWYLNVNEDKIIYNFRW